MWYYVSTKGLQSYPAKNSGLVWLSCLAKTGFDIQLEQSKNENHVGSKIGSMLRDVTIHVKFSWMDRYEPTAYYYRA